jgi:hypothetical protein
VPPFFLGKYPIHTARARPVPVPVPVFGSGRVTSRGKPLYRNSSEISSESPLGIGIGHGYGTKLPVSLIQGAGMFVTIVW